MPKEYRAGSPFRAEDNFHDRFRRAFGREMTAEERRFFKLANIALDETQAEQLALDEEDSAA